METSDKVDLIRQVSGLFIVIVICWNWLIFNGAIIYSGENYTMDLSDRLDNITSIQVINNNSFINITLDNLKASVKIPEDYNFGLNNITTISFIFSGYKNGEEVIIKKPMDSGTCLTTYDCSSWSICINNIQTRTCNKKISDCYAKPVNLTQSCSLTIEEQKKNDTIVLTTEKPKPNIILSWIKSYIWIIALVILVIVVVSFITIKIKSNRNDIIDI